MGGGIIKKSSQVRIPQSIVLRDNHIVYALAQKKAFLPVSVNSSSLSAELNIHKL